MNQSEKALSIRDFGYWKVLEKDTNKKRYLICRCKCGNTKSIRADSLLNSDSMSCGCYAAEETSKRLKGKFKTDAVYKHPLYKIYMGMFNRCYNETGQDYQWYGGRGIKVDDKWISPKRDVTGFLNFLEDMEDTYEKGLELDRLDVNGKYSPSNCKWVTRKSQLHNTTRNRNLKGWGIYLNVTEWGYLLKFNGKMLDDRINKLKWEEPLEAVLEKTFKDRQFSLLYKGNICSASEIWKREGFTEGQRNGRLNKYGDSINALRMENIDFEIVSPREKEYLSFEEGLKHLRDKDKDSFEEHLLYKIESQLEEKNE